MKTRPKMWEVPRSQLGSKTWQIYSSQRFRVILNLFETCLKEALLIADLFMVQPSEWTQHANFVLPLNTFKIIQTHQLQPRYMAWCTVTPQLLQTAVFPAAVHKARHGIQLEQLVLGRNHVNVGGGWGGGTGIQISIETAIQMSLLILHLRPGARISCSAFWHSLRGLCAQKPHAVYLWPNGRQRCQHIVV